MDIPSGTYIAIQRPNEMIFLPEALKNKGLAPKLSNSLPIIREHYDIINEVLGLIKETAPWSDWYKKQIGI